MPYKDSEYHKKYRETHKKERREYREKNKKKIRKRSKKYCQNHKEQINKHRRIYMRSRRENPKHKLSSNISTAIYLSLRGNKNGRHWESLVGYTLNDLIKHLERQFDSEMSWDNYGSYWWVDHITPISIFNFGNYNQIDFKRCWALKNLRPLEKYENIKKGNGIVKPLQLNFKV